MSLIRAINRNTKVAVCSAVDPNAIFNTKNHRDFKVNIQAQ